MEIQNILILRFRRVGDAVLSSVLCTTLRDTFPDARIHYVLNEEIAPLFEHHPAIDRVITFNKADMKNFGTYLKKVYHIIHEGKYDLIIDTRSTVKTLWFSIFSLQTKYRIGRKKAYNLLLQNYRVDTDIEGDEVDRTLRLLLPLEKKFKVGYNRGFAIRVTDDEKESFRRLMEAKGIDFSKPIIVCAAATRVACKAWDRGRMLQVLSRIIQAYDAQLIFNFGSKEEEQISNQIKADMGNHPRIFTEIKADNLRELAAMLSLSDFFFGNEGGPRHISQALNVPSFAVYPPSVPKKIWLPDAGERFQGIQPADITDKALDPALSFADKFAFVTVDELWNHLSPMLDKYL